MIIATQSALDADGDLLEPDERSDIAALMATLRETMKASDDAAVIEGAVQALARGTESFAARRMNEGIRKALAGKNLEAI
jgi:molecular chaperone HscA